MSAGASKNWDDGLPTTSRKIDGDGAFRELLRRYKRNAHKRSIPFLLTDAQFRHLTSQPCHYCGVDPASTLPQFSQAANYPHNGVDRKDPSLSYTPENCVPACTRCNMAKGKMGVDEFALHVSYIFHNYLKCNQ